MPCHRRGWVYAEKGDDDKAIADLTKVIQLYPIIKRPYVASRLMEAYNTRGDAYRKKYEYDKAMADNTQIVEFGHGLSKDAIDALAFSGSAVTAHYKRGICYDEKCDHGKAMIDCTEAIRLGPELKNNEDLKKRMGK